MGGQHPGQPGTAAFCPFSDNVLTTAREEEGSWNAITKSHCTVRNNFNFSTYTLRRYSMPCCESDCRNFHIPSLLHL